MLLGFVVLYLVLSIALGLYAATKVHNAQDYFAAGRALPIWVVIAMVFATWFGAETVLGIPATFMGSNLGGLISDPFGATMALLVFALFFARKLYRMNLLTIADFYRRRYDGRVELVTALAIALSYLGWVSAQITALGLVFSVLSDGQVSQAQGIMIGAAIVLSYTILGGMWSVALTTAFQMVVIVLGLLYIAWLVAGQAGGIAPVVSHAAANAQFEFWPELETVAIIAFISGLITMGFGSTPQQDVFQRANSAKNENVAVWGTVLGALCYFLFAAVPIYIAYSAHIIDPELVRQWIGVDAQKILPELIKGDFPLFAQVIFYGALLAVIMSTASGTLLAPSVTIAQNVIKPLVNRYRTRPGRAAGGAGAALTDRQLLTLTRVVVAVFAALVTLYALWAAQLGATIHEMVKNAYKVTLVMAFVPLVAGLYWKRASALGAYLAIGFGLAVWVPMEIWLPEGEGPIPPQFAGFLAAVAGMVTGSLLSPRPPAPAAAAKLG